MTDLTIGQRIAERRKLLSLSQEALGEKMGVSRQAISKWEADAAVPEIDKLIAMSKLFSVSVGWLLGTESDVPGQEEKESFTEEQLLIVEEIVKRYHQPAQKKRDWVPAVVAGVLLVVAVVFAGLLFWDYIDRFTGYVSGQIYSANSNYGAIQEQLEGLTDRLDELAKGEKLLESYTLEGTAWEDLTGATVRFSGIPKYTVAGETAWISVRLNEAEVAKAQCTTDGVVYTAEVDLPAADGYSYHFLVTYEEGGGAQQILTEAGDAYINVAQGLRGSVDMEFYSYGWSYRDWNYHLDAATLIRSAPELLGNDQDLQWQQIDLVMYHNGKEWERISLLERFGLEPDSSYSRKDTMMGTGPDIGYATWICPLPEMEEGDTILIDLEYRHPGTDTISQREMELLYESGDFTRIYQTTFG